MDCEICVFPFNRSTRKQITCPSCRLNVCVACVKQVPSKGGLLDITCMQCNHLWDTEFVAGVSRSVVVTHKKRVEKLLVDQERTKLPETQYYLQYDHAMDHVVRPRIQRGVRKLVELQDELERELQELRDEMVKEDGDGEARFTWPEDGPYAQVRDIHREIRTTRREVNRLSQHLDEWNFHKRMTYTEYIPEQLKTTSPGNEENKKKKKPAQHVFPCPQENKDCPGFVMDDGYACGTCASKCCDKCHQPEHSSKECEPNFLATAREIRQNTKPCPKCAVRIHKIEGCDQMWCTQCRTGFSWRTGEVESAEDRIHNPHYFEWAARNNNGGNLENNNNNCRPVHVHLLTHCGVLFGTSEDYGYFTEHFRLNSHVRFFEIEQRFGGGPANHVQDADLHLDLRLKFLKKDITEKHLGTVLYKRHKETRVNARRVQVLHFFVDASNDIFHRLMYQCTTASQATPLKHELDALVEYTNECFQSLKKVYHMKMPVVRFENGTFEVSRFNGFLFME